MNSGPAQSAHRQRGALRLRTIVAPLFVASIALPFPHITSASSSLTPDAPVDSATVIALSRSLDAALPPAPEGKTSPSIPLLSEGESRTTTKRRGDILRPEPAYAVLSRRSSHQTRSGKAASPNAGKDNRSAPADTRVAAAQPPAPSDTLAFLASQLPPPGAPRETLLEVHINGQDGYGTATLMSLDSDPNESLYASDSDLKRWRLQLPDVSPREYAGEKFYLLRAIPGLQYHVDNSTATLWITAAAKDFTGTTVIGGLMRDNPQPQPTPLGGFLNYDFFATGGGGQTAVNGLFETGIFNSWGVGTSSFLDQNFGRAHSHLVRLDTVWRHDNLQNMTSLSFGDSYTRSSMTGLSVNMAGVQFGTNFSTRPYFISFPLPSLAGEATLPSTAQLYVNGLLKQTTQIPPGAFSLPAVPTQSQSGNVTLVVRDALGHQQIITTSFYAGSELLKAGLNDYSFSLGKIRENYGINSNDYGPFVAAALFRHGFNEYFTGEVHGDASAGLQDFGMGASFATYAMGEFNTGFAVSHSNLGRGVLGSVGYRRQWKVINIGASVKLASPRFTGVGYNGQPAPRKQITATLGAFFGRAGSASLIYLDQDSTLFGRARILSAGYNVGIGRGSLNINFFHSLTGSSGNGLSLTFSMPIGQRTSSSFGMTSGKNLTRAYAQIQQSLPSGTGSGYRINTEFGPGAINSAEYDYQNSAGTWRAGAYRSGSQTVYQGEASGSLAFLDNHLFFSRKLDSSFGLIEVPGLANVPIYAQNQPVAVTDKNGNALVPRLLPYQNNSVSLSAENLPLSVQVGALQINAVPRYRSAIVVKFPISSNRGATLSIKLENGKPLPAGATVKIAGEKRTFPVALDGELYITGLADHNKLQASWNGQHCDIEVSMPKKTSDPLPDLGVFVCKGITQ